MQSTQQIVGSVKVRDVLKLLQNDGGISLPRKGVTGNSNIRRVTVAGHPSDDVHPKTLKSILTQAGLKK